MRRIHPLAAAAFAGYAASILLSLWDVVDGLILPPLAGGIGFLAFVAVPAFAVLILLWAVLAAGRPGPRWRIAIPALMLGFLVLWLAPAPLFRHGISRFVQRPELNAFAARVHRYGRITNLTEEDGKIWSLNGTSVARTRDELDSVRGEWYGKDARLLADVLARDGIAPAVSDDFLRELRRFHLRRLSVHGGYVLFARSRDAGLVYASRGAPPLAPGGSVPGTGVRLVGERMGRWYRYACCTDPPTVSPDSVQPANASEKDSLPN